MEEVTEVNRNVKGGFHLLSVKLIQHKTNDILRSTINKRNQTRLTNRNPSILCNNCLGGFILHDLGLEFRTPTINLYIDGAEFLTFLEHLEGFLSCELKEVCEPCYLSWMQPAGFPVGKLELRESSETVQESNKTESKAEEITVYFIHYQTFAQAKASWERRKQRINLENLFILFQLDAVSDKAVAERLERLPYANKICLTFRDGCGNRNLIYEMKGGREHSYPWDYKGSFGLRYYDDFDYVGWLNRGVRL